MPEDLRVIVAGAGRVGGRLAGILDDRGHDVVIVESDERRCEKLSDRYVATVIQGDATRPGLLEEASVEKSDVIAAMTGQTGNNLAVCMVARQMDGSIRTVARVDSPAGEEYTRFVDAVVYPEEAGASLAANEVEGGDVQSLVDVTRSLDILDIEVAEGAPAAGKSLQEVHFPRGTLVISDADGRRVARSDTVLTPGKRYVVAVEPDVVDEVRNLMRG